ncbi:MAG: hypothetical protein ACK4N5_20805, partial [Myxococcales bacterium]
SGLGWIDPAEPAIEVLSQTGFALLMLIAGTHLPLRAPALRGAIASGVAATVLVAVLAIPVAVLLSTITSIDRVPLLLLLLVTSSAVVVMPVLAASGPPEGLALRALGDEAGARAEFEKAAARRGRFAELARKEAAPAATA